MPTLRKIKMYYDPLGRVVKTVNPDKSEQWVVYGRPEELDEPENVIPTPWENFAYDANDLASISNPGSSVPATDYFTPKSSLVDALGRTVKTKEFFDNSNYGNTIEMNYSYDIRGNLMLVKDPYNRKVFEHVYDLRPPQKDEPLPPLKTVHIDKGTSTVLFDALGKPIESFDAKGAHSLSAYDTLQRPTHSWAKNKTGDTITLRNYLIYGEAAATPATFNLNAQVYQSYDEAGFVETPEYDFKGNLLTKKRQVIDDSVIKVSLNAYNAYLVDWTGLPSILNSFVYENNFEFDALNRVTKITLPTDVNTFRKDITPLYNRAGALEKVSYDGTDYVKHIAYNAKGQRILIAMGNDVMSRYVYDDFTFRLIRQRSEAFVFSQSGNTQTYAYQSGTNKQDDKYLYDLIGNITEINLRTSTCGVGGTNSLDRTFAYDSIYRLTQATGRENVTGASYPFPGWQDQTRSTTPNTTVAYTRNYSYDKLGNIQQIQQIGTNAFTRTYNYIANTNELGGVTIGSNSYAFTYDACGNQLTENVNRKFDWDATDRLLFFRDQVGSSEPTVEAQYMYDASGQRVKKIVRKQGGIFEIRVYIDGVFEFFTDEVDTQNTVHIMDNQSRVATVRIGAAIGDPTPAIKYELSDIIGSSMVLLDTLGAEVNAQEYYPFGETSFGSYAKKRYQYVGKERDEESGLYFYGARYYSPWTCRFISVDPLAAKYAQLTPYNFADNNPINDFDIDGMQDNNTQATPTGSGGSVPQGNSGSSGGCMTCPQTNANTPKANKEGLSDLNEGQSVTKHMAGGNKTKPLQSVDKNETTRQDNLKTPKVAPLNRRDAKKETTISADTRTDFEHQQQKAYNHQIDFGGGDGTGGFADKYFEAKKVLLDKINNAPATIQLPLLFAGPLTAEFKAITLATTTAEAGTIGFRYMSTGELKAIQETGFLRGGNSGPTFFTKDIFTSASKAQMRLGLEKAPQLRVEFEILNEPNLLRTGTKVEPTLKGMLGGGSEFMTLDPVKVRIINYQPLLKIKP